MLSIFFCSHFRVIAVAIATTGVLTSSSVSQAENSVDRIDVAVDQAKLVKLPSQASTIVIGNPMIADVTLQAGGILIVTGKGYGATNIIAMDGGGKILSDRVVQVTGPTDKVVTVYRGVDRESYSCTPVCQRRVTLGDTPAYFTATLGQTGNFSRQATDNAKAAAANVSSTSSSTAASPDVPASPDAPANSSDSSGSGASSSVSDASPDD
jgi:hypothetical protein